MNLDNLPRFTGSRAITINELQNKKRPIAPHKYTLISMKCKDFALGALRSDIGNE